MIPKTSGAVLNIFGIGWQVVHHDPVSTGWRSRQGRIRTRTTNVDCPIGELKTTTGSPLTDGSLEAIDPAPQGPVCIG